MKDKVRNQNILILRTNIDKKKKIKMIKPIFNHHPNIIDWSIDIEDIDKVLRIETNGNISENDISEVLKTVGLFAENLDNN